MTLGMEQISYKAGYNYRPCWRPNPESPRKMTPKELATTKIPHMDPAGKISPGLVEETIESKGQLIKTGRMVPGLQVQMVRKIRIGKYGGRTFVYGKPKPLSAVCKKDGETIDTLLQERGYLPKMPQEIEAIQGRG